jgi:hypothetical protein
MPEVSAGSSARIFQPPKAVLISSRLAPGGRGPCRPGLKASSKSVASGAAAAVTQSAIACRPGPGRWWKQGTALVVDADGVPAPIGEINRVGAGAAPKVDRPSRWCGPLHGFAVQKSPELLSCFPASSLPRAKPDRIRHRVKTAHRLSPVVLVVTGRPWPASRCLVVTWPAGRARLSGRAVRSGRVLPSARRSGHRRCGQHRKR